MLTRNIAIFLIAAFLGSSPCTIANGDSLDELRRHLPAAASEFSDSQVAGLSDAAAGVEQWAADVALKLANGTSDTVLVDTRRLLDAKVEVDRLLDNILKLRSQFVQVPADDPHRQEIRCFLRTTSNLIDLSGRLRYLLRDVIDTAAYRLDPHPAKIDQLLTLLIDKRSSIGAAVMSYLLFDPAPGSAALPLSPERKARVLRLFTATRTADLVPTLAAFVRQERDPRLVVSGVDVIRYIGIPQSPRPGQDPTLPAPSILAEELAELLGGVDESRLAPVLRKRRRELIAQMRQRIERGVLTDSYRIGDYEVRAGDWLLMRNPSPYNLFTDLSPGLFTHVGVVGVETSEDGIRRFVLVDLPERGARVPATNVDMYVDRTLHYFFMRHEDASVANRMGQAAVDMIDNETQFDLTFDTSRVLKMRGKPLEDTPIHTYCAGFLLLCAQHAEAPRTEFFPIGEFPAGGNTLTNLRKLGLSIGDDFISPTGAIFSPHLRISGRRVPMYHPGREVKEAIYDHFATCMRTKVMTPSPSAYQALREKVAALAQRNALLARALAQASNVSQHIDLASAAKAAAVIETLDEIANANKDAYYAARRAIVAGANADVDTLELREEIERYRRQHADLVRRWSAGRLSPRQLRIELVESYAERGKQQLDARFFSDLD